MTKESSQKQIEELEAEIERLRKLIHHDFLTEALNRHGFKEHVIPFFKRALFDQRSPEKGTDFKIKSFTILFIDIDNFKEINDNFGHQVGDDTLKKIIKIIRGAIRKADFVGRWGGEEIVVALLGPGKKGAERIAEKILKSVEKEAVLNTESGEKNVTVSIGVASISRDIRKMEELIAMADKAMYVAKKERGKNNIVFHSEISK